ncbi:hypothetical protein DPMN_100405 [Dreissena polymorpha]|uniref:Uncharacterized protein n=1 Tax=Dreissena polymorpha TaxID=45954 RepID=A0A9D4R951_DREPO|nr:hypothetical protein DPMN_100405 [Dreissena polymorpha]
MRSQIATYGQATKGSGTTTGTAPLTGTNRARNRGSKRSWRVSQLCSKMLFGS